MDSMQEKDAFSQWCARHIAQSDGEQMRAYGRRIITDQRGRPRKRPFRIGTVIVADDGLAFLRKVSPIPAWGIALIVLAGLAILVGGTMIGFVTGKTPIFLIGVPTLAVYFGAIYWALRPADLSDPSRLAQSIGHPGSVFVPMSCITSVEACDSFGWANPAHLSILYRRNSESRQEELILGDMASGKVHFNAPELYRKLRRQLRGLKQTQTDGEED